MRAGRKKVGRRSDGKKKKKKKRAGKELQESRDGAWGGRWTVRGCSGRGEEGQVQEEVVEEEEEGRRDEMMIGRAGGVSVNKKAQLPLCPITARRPLRQNHQRKPGRMFYSKGSKVKTPDLHSYHFIPAVAVNDPHSHTLLLQCLMEVCFILGGGWGECQKCLAGMISPKHLMTDITAAARSAVCARACVRLSLCASPSVCVWPSGPEEVRPADCVFEYVWIEEGPP